MTGSSVFDYVHQQDHAEVAEQLGLGLASSTSTSGPHSSSSGLASPSSAASEEHGSSSTANPDGNLIELMRMSVALYKNMIGVSHPEQEEGLNCLLCVCYLQCPR